MKPIIRLSFFLLMLLSGQAGSTQSAPLDFNLIKKFNGISVGKINSITQDRSGYMWFADNSNAQLIRFDGYKMKRFKYEPSDSNSLDKGGGSECVAADSLGNVWTNTVSGIDKFDPATKKFTHYRYKLSERPAISQILVDHLGTVWVATDKGLDQLDQKNGTFIHHPHKDNDSTSISCDIVRCLCEDREGTIWAGTGWEFDSTMKEGGLNKFNRATGKFMRYKHDASNPQSLAGNKVRAIFEDSRGVFWVGTDGDGLHIMDRKTGLFERLAHDPKHPEKLSRPPLVTTYEYSDHITFITEDGAGSIWIGTFYAGIMRYDPATKKINHYDSADRSRPKGFTDNSSWGAFRSRDGVLWISTQWEENLFRVDPLQSAVSLVDMGDGVSNIYQDSTGTTWACLDNNGLLRTGAAANDKQYFRHDPKDPYSLSRNHVSFIQPDTNGLFWVGTMNGLNHFDPRTGKFKRYLYSDVSKGDFKDTAVFNLLKGDNGEIYLSGNLGFFMMDAKTGLLKRYEHDPADTASISNGFTTGLCKDRSGKIWVGTWSGGDGLNLFDPQTKKFKHYLPGLIVSNIYQDKSGTIWAGTDDGLYYHNYSNPVFSPLETTRPEFRTAFIFQVGWEDGEGNIWGFSSLGVFRVSPAKNEVAVYGAKFGIDRKNFGAFMQLKDGRFAVSQDRGYYVFRPSGLMNRVPPNPMLTAFKVNGKPIAQGEQAPYIGPIEEAERIQLNYDQNSFSIEFAAIHYSSPEDNMTYYMLGGYDSNWIKSDSLNVAEYRNIPTGKYLLKIKACSSYGVWAAKEVSIIISPPWWIRWWALGLYGLVFFLLIWGIIKWRTSAIGKEKIVLEKKVADRTRELKKEKEIVEITLAELKSAQSQLIQSEKMASLGQLTAGIAHEIQNPLNFVNNFSEVSSELIDEMKAELALDNKEDALTIADELKSNLEKINHHGKRADAIVKGMLQHSQTSKGQKELTDINALVDQYLRLAYNGFRAKDNSFHATLAPDYDTSIGKIYIMQQDIGRVLLNLCTNACYAVNEKKKSNLVGYEPIISVSTKRIDNQLSITVSDNGNGIAENIVDKIFQPFFTTKPTGQGTGLGLSLSYDIIKAHSGTLTVETLEKEFAAFIIILPA